MPLNITVDHSQSNRNEKSLNITIDQATSNEPNEGKKRLDIDYDDYSRDNLDDFSSLVTSAEGESIDTEYEQRRIHSLSHEPSQETISANEPRSHHYSEGQFEVSSLETDDGSPMSHHGSYIRRRSAGDATGGSSAPEPRISPFNYTERWLEGNATPKQQRRTDINYEFGHRQRAPGNSTRSRRDRLTKSSQQQNIEDTDKAEPSFSKHDWRSLPHSAYNRSSRLRGVSPSNISDYDPHVPYYPQASLPYPQPPEAPSAYSHGWPYHPSEYTYPPGHQVGYPSSFQGYPPLPPHAQQGRPTAMPEGMFMRQSLVARQSTLETIPSNDPFFEEDFRLFNLAESPQSKVTCKITICNEVKAFKDSELGENDSIKDLVVLTGDVHGDQLWATTCSEYVSARWPRSSKNIQSMFDFICNKSDAKTPMLSLNGHQNDSAVGVSRSYSDQGLSFDLFGTVEDQIDLVQAMAWLSAVTVNGDELSGGEPVASGARLERDRQRRVIQNEFRIRNDVYEPLLPQNDAIKGTCWKPLFPRTASAIEFPGRPRPLGMYGVEISFDLMCFICGLEYEVIEDGGLVLYGQRSCVYPVQHDEYTSNCVQWHFEPRHATQKSPSDLKRPRVKIDNLELLSQAPRHFLGLWKDPDIVLGTERSTNFEDIWWSSAEELKKTQNLDSRTFGGEVTLPKALNLIWTQTYKVAKSRRNIFMRDFSGYLHQKMNSPVLLYSPSEKRAWLVSFLSVLLHLARSRAHFQRVLGHHVPACEVSSNGGQAAFDCLLACYRQPLKQARENEILAKEEQDYRIEEYVSEVKAVMDSITDESFKARGLFRSQIVGFELADIARLKPTMTMKRHKLPFGTGWSPILDRVELALFYEGLPDPILERASPQSSPKPTSTCELTTWKAVPQGFDLLTASLPCLVNLLESVNPDRNLHHLTSDYRWHSPMSGNPFDYCVKEKHHICNRLQEFCVDRRGLEVTPPPISHAFAKDRGAVVFRYKDGIEHIRKTLEASESKKSSTAPRGLVLRTSSKDSGYGSLGVSKSNEESLATDVSRPYKANSSGSGFSPLSSQESAPTPVHRSGAPKDSRRRDSSITEQESPSPGRASEDRIDEERPQRRRRHRSHRQSELDESHGDRLRASRKHQSAREMAQESARQSHTEKAAKDKQSDPQRSNRRKEGKFTSSVSRFFDRYLSD